MRQRFSNRLPDASTINKWCKNTGLGTDAGMIQSSLDSLEQLSRLKQEDGGSLVVSLVFDEMAIRQHVQWAKFSRKMLGYSTYGEKRGIAKQAIVYMVSGVNQKIKLPIAYQFICSIDSTEKKSLLLSIIDALNDRKIRVLNITFDGHSSNIKMCSELGANMRVNSPEFCPMFTHNGQKIFIWLDPCHMIKLIRNAFGSRNLFDCSDNKIEWKYIKRLVAFGQQTGYSLSHKLKKRHLEWEQCKMNVKLAVQTLSASTADAIQFLTDAKEKGFLGAEPTIDFIRLFNDLFDIFNTKDLDHSKIFKSALNPKNKDVIFAFFSRCIDYIKNMQISYENSRKKRVCTSKVNTGFVGLIVDMYSLKKIYEQFVNNEVMSFIPTYALSQDHVEILFGKIRSANGCNDNPTVQQFGGAIRKIISSKILQISNGTNCIDFENTPYKSSGRSMLTVSSEKKRSVPGGSVAPPDDDLDKVYDKIAEIEGMETDNPSSVDNFNDFSITHIAQIIENKIKCASGKHCSSCLDTFNQDEKMEVAFSSDKYPENPSVSTFRICKIADRFLNETMFVSGIDFNAIYQAICENTDESELFRATDFSHDASHKKQFIKLITDNYIDIKGTYIAQMVTSSNQKKLRRAKFKNLLHLYGE